MLRKSTFVQHGTTVRIIVRIDSCCHLTAEMFKEERDHTFT